MYDENEDTKNEEWNRKRTKAFTNESTHSTDAVLNCPCCFTVLCLDCQQHEIYKTQYRSMFVINCTVDTGNPLQEKKVKSEIEGTIAPSPLAGNKEAEPAQKMDATQDEQEQVKARITRNEEEEKDTPESEETIQHSPEKEKRRQRKKQVVKSETYLNVHCTICRTQVAMYDEEQVFHFFNVLASHP